MCQHWVLPGSLRCRLTCPALPGRLRLRLPLPAGALVMAPTLLLPSVHLGLSGGLAFNAEVGGGQWMAGSQHLPAPLPQAGGIVLGSKLYITFRLSA